MRLVTAAEMQALDRQVIDQIGVPGVVLMDAAGRGVVEVLARVCDLERARVVVYAGAGNNGGDGFVVARHLANRGVPVEVILCAAQQKVTGDARTHLDACRRSGVEILDGASAEGLAAAAARTAGASIVVDALLGTGLTREVSGQLGAAICRINDHAGLKVAVDLPSGLDSDRGVPLGVCVRADHTVTFALAKRGLVSAPGFTYAGVLHVVDIGIPARLAQSRAELLDESVLGPLRRSRDPLGHKGTHGHLLVVAGSPGKAGAALLCGSAALRSGAGLVTLAAPAQLEPVLDGRVPELMAYYYGALGEVEAALDGKRALAVGPGMPTGPDVRAALGALLRAAATRGVGLVLDADALNHLAAAPELLDGVNAPVVLTPHPGEAARLAGRSTAEVQNDRIAVALALAARFSAVVALKGARTVVAAPDGRLAICPTGNSGMGTGGTGDVLTGVVGALLAEGMAPFEAASAAVYLHGAAGDLAAAEHGQRGLVAHDVVDALGRALH